MTETTNMPSLLMCGTGIGREGKRPIGMGLSVGTAETDASQSWISALSQALQPVVQPEAASSDGFPQPIVAAKEVRSGDERSHTNQQTARRKGDGLIHLMSGFAMQPMMSSVQGQIQSESEETTSGESRQNQAEEGGQSLVSNRKQESTVQLATPVSMKLTHGSEPMSGTLSLFAKPPLLDDTEWKDQNLPGNVDLHTFSRDGVSVAMLSSVDETHRTSLQIPSEVGSGQSAVGSVVGRMPHHTPEGVAPSTSVHRGETRVEWAIPKKPAMGVISETSVVGELPSDEFQSMEIDPNRDEILWVSEETSFGTRVHSKPSMDEGGADESAEQGTNTSVSTFLEAEMPANLVRNASDKPIHRSSQQVDVVEIRAFEKLPHVKDSGPKIATEGNVVPSNRITEQTTNSGYSSTMTSPASYLDGTEWRAVSIEAEQRVLSEGDDEYLSMQPIERDQSSPQKSQLLDSDHDSVERLGSPLTERPIASGSEKQASTEGRTDDSEDGLQQMKTVRSVEKKGTSAGKVFIPIFGSTESDLKSRAIVPGKQTDRIFRQFDVEGIRSTIANAVLKYSTGSTEIQMSLKPEWLGSMTMRIQSEEGKLQIHIVTEHQTTRDILEAQVQSLRSEMEGKGLVIEKIQVDLSGSRNDGQVGTGVGQWTSYQQQRENGTFFAFEPDEKPITDKQEVTYESTMEPMPKGRLNAFA